MFIIRHINIPNSVIDIGEDAFRNCRNLKNVILPNSIKVIKRGIFDGCSSLNSIHMNILDIDNIKISSSDFNSNIFDNCTLYVQPGTRWIYRHHPIFGKFKNIEIENNIEFDTSF